MLWLTHELGDGEQACELVTSFSVYRGFGNKPTFAVNDRPMDGTVTDGVLLMEYIKDLMRHDQTVFVSLYELCGFSPKPSTTR